MTTKVSNETTGRGGPRPNSGRPPGTSKLESSDIVARLHTASGMTQEDLGRAVGCSTSSIKTYIRNSVVPKPGTAVRIAIDKLAKKLGVLE